MSRKRRETRSHWKRRLAANADATAAAIELSEAERAELDRMIAATKAANAGQVKLVCFPDMVPISGIGGFRAWIYAWTLNGKTMGMVGYRNILESEENRAAYQAKLIKYFSDAVNPKSITLHKPDGSEERIK